MRSDGAISTVNPHEILERPTVYSDMLMEPPPPRELKQFPFPLFGVRYAWGISYKIKCIKNMESIYFKKYVERQLCVY